MWIAALKIQPELLKSTVMTFVMTFVMTVTCWLLGRDSAEPDAGERSDSSQGPLQRRERLVQERRLVEVDSLRIKGSSFPSSDDLII